MPTSISDLISEFIQAKTEEIRQKERYASEVGLEWYAYGHALIEASTTAQDRLEREIDRQINSKIDAALKARGL